MSKAGAKANKAFRELLDALEEMAAEHQDYADINKALEAHPPYEEVIEILDGYLDYASHHEPEAVYERMSAWYGNDLGLDTIASDEGGS